MFNRGQKISRVLSRYKGEEALLCIYDILKKTYDKKPKKLREDERDVYHVMTLYLSLKEGGFKNFYLSAEGNDALDISKSLAKLSCDDFYNYLYESMQVFSGMISGELFVRDQYYQQNKSACEAKWHLLDQQFSNHQKKFIEQVNTFIRENILSFR